MLISSIATLKKYIPTVVGSDFERYSPFLQTAEEYLASDLIGDDILEGLTVTDNVPYGITGYADDLKLVRYCEAIVCLKAYHDAIPMLDLVETETGFGVVSNTNIAPASQQRVAALLAGIEKRLTDAIEQLLEYLEGNPDYYIPWKYAKAYAINHDSYIFTLKQFRRYGRYDLSRLEWIKDMPKVTQAIRYKIEPVISSELSLAIIDQLQDDTLSPNNALIIENLRFALAAFVLGLECDGIRYLGLVYAHLVANATDYPEFESSTIYAAYLARTSNYSIEQQIAMFGV